MQSGLIVLFSYFCIMINGPSDYTVDFPDNIDEHTVKSGFIDENISGQGASCEQTYFFPI